MKETSEQVNDEEIIAGLERLRILRFESRTDICKLYDAHRKVDNVLARINRKQEGYRLN